ncbi:protein nessun dorma isoform X2 [Hyposmocoma kahamanoa]|nr:protein nessun dorma isoform X2 [Hyposmocoma kahamanoa]
MRFFYNNLWMPWDDQDDKVFLSDTIEDRMELWLDLHNGTIPNCVARNIKLLRNSAINAYERLRALDSSLCEEDMADEDDSMLPPNYIILCAELTARLDSHMSQWTLYEKSLIRKQYLAKAKKKWQKNKSKRNVVALWRGGSIFEFDDISKYLRTHLTSEHTLTVTVSAEEALSLEPEELLVCSKEYEIPEMPLSQISITGFKGTSLKAPDMRSCLLILSEICSLRELTLHCSNVNTVVHMSTGTLTVRRCVLRNDSYSSQVDFAQGIVAKPGANILIEDSTFDNFYSGIVVYKGAQVELRNCTLKNCSVGIQLYSGSKVTLNKTNISACAEQCIRCEVDSDVADKNSVEGLEIKPNCTIGSGNLQKEVLIVKQDVSLI